MANPAKGPNKGWRFLFLVLGIGFAWFGWSLHTDPSLMTDPAQAADAAKFSFEVAAVFLFGFFVATA